MSYKGTPQSSQIIFLEQKVAELEDKLYQLESNNKHLQETLDMHWEPIENAPRDGTQILACDINDTHNPDRVFITWWGEKWGSLQWGSDITNEFGGWETPTHWMMRPKLPSGKLDRTTIAERNRELEEFVVWVASLKTGGLIQGKATALLEKKA
jgi:hypothetical protein